MITERQPLHIADVVGSSSFWPDASCARCDGDGSLQDSMTGEEIPCDECERAPLAVPEEAVAL